MVLICISPKTNNIKTFYGPEYSQRLFHVHLKRMDILYEVFNVSYVKLVDSVMSSISLLIFCLVLLSIIASRVLKFITYYWITYFSFVSFYITYFGAVVRQIFFNFF